MTTMTRIDMVNEDIRYLASKGFDVVAVMNGGAMSVMLKNLELPRCGRWTSHGVPVHHACVCLNLPPTWPWETPGGGPYEPTYPIHVRPLELDGTPLADSHVCAHSPTWRWLCWQQLEIKPSTPRPLVALVQILEISLVLRAERTRQ